MYQVGQAGFPGLHVRGVPRSHSGRKTGFYNHDKPYVDTIQYFNYFKPAVTVTAPAAYIVPFAWEYVIDRLKANGVQMQQLEKDTTLTVESYYIDQFEPATRGTQGHYFNSNIKVHSVTQKMDYFRGDYIVPVNQRANKYIVYMLELVERSRIFCLEFFRLLARRPGLVFSLGLRKPS